MTLRSNLLEAEAKSQTKATTPDKAKKELKELFELFDLDSSKGISKNEFTTVIRAFGLNPTEQELNEYYSEMDKSNNNSVSLAEFQDYMLTNNLHEIDADMELREAFRIFDRNKDGYIDATELRKTMKMLDNGMSDKELDDMMKLADINDDNKISLNEYVKLLNS